MVPAFWRRVFEVQGEYGDVADASNPPIEGEGHLSYFSVNRETSMAPAQDGHSQVQTFQMRRESLQVPQSVGNFVDVALVSRHLHGIVDLAVTTWSMAQVSIEDPWRTFPSSVHIPVQQADVLTESQSRELPRDRATRRDVPADCRKERMV